MATYSAVSASEKDADSIVDVSLIDKLDQNPHAIAEGASGAPQIQSAAIADNSITAAKIPSSAVGQSEIASGAVHRSELDTSSGTVTLTGVSGDFVLPGGEYGFYPQVRTETSSDESKAQIAFTFGSTSYITNIFLDGKSSTGGNRDMYARQRYINSSPPVDMGDGNVPLFFFAKLDPSGKVIMTYAADAPPWLYNGPTNTQPDIVLKNGIKKKLMRSIDPATKRVTKDLVNFDADIKNADMEIIPHPFVNDKNVGTIILLDPPATEELLDLHEAGEEVHKLIKDDYIRIGNDSLSRSCPSGVMPVSFRWRDTMSR
tara:strand:- start:126 stop:1073 length:948 start_codon:yes stop_codon:yes gene_type:complete